MRPTIAALLATASVALASQTVFSVHDDLLAYPQYEVAFADDIISDVEAAIILRDASSSATNDAPQSSNTKSVSSQGAQDPPAGAIDSMPDNIRRKYEMMNLKGENHLCAIPIVDMPVKNETSEAEARAAEQKEMARATDRGWELLQDLGGDKCLHFMSGWWSYDFCYNSEIVQYHQLPTKAGKAPRKDPSSKEYVLGKVKPAKEAKKGDEWGNEVEVRKERKHRSSPKTELQIKGDTRYLVQKMEGGTTCDLTGKPRRIEIQYHCNPHVTDRIGYIKEVTTCSYLMAIHTPRLCNDVAFLPPKETTANQIICRVVVPEEDLAYRNSLKTLETELEAKASKATKPIVVGGLVVGAGKWSGKDGKKITMPTSFELFEPGVKKQTIASAKSKKAGGEAVVLSDEVLQKMDLDPEMVEDLKAKVQKLAKESGWKIEVVDAPGEEREIYASVVDEEEEAGPDEKEDDKKAGSQEGSQEVFKEEL